jgi:hypothetical protein
MLTVVLHRNFILAHRSEDGAHSVQRDTSILVIVKDPGTEVEPFVKLQCYRLLVLVF